MEPKFINGMGLNADGSPYLGGSFNNTTTSNTSPTSSFDSIEDIAAASRGLGITKVAKPNYVQQVQDNVYGKYVDGNYISPDRIGSGGVTTDETRLWGGRDGYLATGASVAQGLGSLAGAYTGLKGLGMASDKFNFEKGLASTNLANSAKLTNSEIDRRAGVASALAGYNPSQRDAYINKQKENYVSGRLA